LLAPKSAKSGEIPREFDLWPGHFSYFKLANGQYLEICYAYTYLA